MPYARRLRGTYALGAVLVVSAVVLRRSQGWETAGHKGYVVGATYPAELAAARQAILQLGGGDAQLQAVPQSEEEMNWFLVVISKTAVTPPKFPRRVGMPVKRPL